ncbi:Equilibrative Nucleoside Transporter (ENT) Family [Achlya hypogyna]|uniref:Equilibrative Nucleoside Transporter (ENT) Family n=1 Tax=Achlya hypogyna TaxID=1202772 RepID=A0A1V9YA91_ACHHY|nr:Equilibrative Nucleoside Transporter (ENT) Family [Achlya hypogyna]
MARPPTDKCHAGYLVLFLQGVAALLPWNVFITADGYFATRLVGTPVHESFLTWFSMGFNLTALFVLAINTLFLRSFLPRPSVKITIALVGILLVVFLSTVLVKTPSITGMVFFNMTMCSIVVASICSAYLQEGLFELASAFPEIYTQAIMTGQSLAGFIVALSSFVITWAHLDPALILASVVVPWAVTDTETSAFSYFVSVLATIGLASVAFAGFLRLPLARYYMAPPAEVAASLESLLEDAPVRKGTQNPAKLLWRVRAHASAVFATFFVTLALFPVLTSAIRSSNPSPAVRALFTPLSFVLFNGGDLLGRVLAGYAPTLLRGRGLLVVALLRVSFLPLFGLCRLTTSGHSVVFDHDAYPIVFLVLCAVSNGVLISLSMMQSAHSVAPHQRELTGALMFFCLTSGCTAGAVASFGTHAWLL